MLQYRTVYPKTLELLKELMRMQELQEFFLVGGTALALHLGHRISVDLDLFTQNDFETTRMFDKLNSKFKISDKTEEENTLNFNIITSGTAGDDIVKVDLIRYPYPLIKPIQVIDQIRLLSVEDIIPMKLSAVAGRGSKKDFYDIYYLLENYTIEQMFDLFDQKFKNTNKFHVLKSLTYFDDADFEPAPHTLEQSDWENIKKTIIRETNDFIKM